MKEENIIFISNLYNTFNLTRNKVYKGKMDGFYYLIKNDMGIEKKYFYKLFKTQKEWRSEKIESIIGTS